MADGNWTVGVDGFAGELHGMRDSVESRGIWWHECERERKRETGGARGRIRGNLVEEGSEDGGRGEW